MSFVGHGWRDGQTTDPSLPLTDSGRATPVVTGRQVSFNVTGGDPNTVYRLSPGEGTSGITGTTSGIGAVSLVYTYTKAGTFRAQIYNTKTNRLAFDGNVTVT